jgi:hypothetical protein
MAMQGAAVTAAQTSSLRRPGMHSEGSFMSGFGGMRIRAWWVGAVTCCSI